MIVYIFLLFLLLVGIIQYDIKKEKINKLEFYYVICIYLTFLSGLSYRLGGDGPSYEEWFSSIPSLGNLNISHFENFTVQPLFLLLGSISKSIVNDVWIFHLFQSGIVCFTMFWFIRKYTIYIFTASLIFVVCGYTYYCFEIWKESLAISMTLVSYYYLDKRKIIKYVIFGLLGFLFHFSGIIFLLFPLLKQLKFNKLFLLILVGLWMFFEVIVEYSAILMYSDLLMTKYDRYLQVADNLNEMWYLMAFCKNVLAPASIGLWFKYVFKNYKFEWSYCSFILLGIGSLQFAVIFERPINYILPFIIVSMAKLIGLTNKLHKKHYITVVLSFLFCISCRVPFLLSHEGWRTLVPYESIFTKERNPERERVINIIHVG